MTEGKGWLLPETIDPGDRICVRFEIPDTREYRAAAAGTIQRLAQWFNWEQGGSGDTRATQAAQLFRQSIFETLVFVENCEDGLMSSFRLRQSPDDPCILEQSFDDGMTWSFAFDYSACLASSPSTTIDIDVGITNVENETNIYNGDPSGYQPEIDGTTNSDTAICYALSVVIRAVLEATISRLENNNNQRLIIQAAAGAIAAAAAFTFGTPVAGLSVAVGVAVGLIATSVAQAQDLEGLKTLRDDDTQLFELTCCAYSALSGTRPTPATFEGAWDSCGTLSTEAAGFLTILQTVAEDLDTFVQFLQTAGTGYDYAVAGVLGNACNECSPDWCREWLEDAGTNGLTINVGNVIGGWPTESIQTTSGTRFWDGASIPNMIDVEFSYASLQTLRRLSVTLSQVSTVANYRLYGSDDGGSSFFIIDIDQQPDGTFSISFDESVDVLRLVSWRDNSDVFQIDALRLEGDGASPYSAGEGVDCT